MSGWDWIHAGLELATYTQAQQAQKNLSAMRTTQEEEMARKVLLEAMKNFIFDISRDIQLAEGQVTTYPQQVYIVSKSLDSRFHDSGLSAELFPDFQDKEYVFQTQKKIKEVIGKSCQSLTDEQVQESDLAVQYIAEMPMLKEAINAKFAQERMMSTDEQWQKLSSQAGKRKLLTTLGLIGLFVSLCVILPVGLSMLGLLGAAYASSSSFGTRLLNMILISVMGLFPIGSIVLLVLAGKANPEMKMLEQNRNNWKSHLKSREEWQAVVTAFGDLSSAQFQKLYEQRVSYLTPLLGGDFQTYLVS